jgi:hypothetical protein
MLLAVALAVLPASQAQATITVANNNDSGAGSLRQAIVDAGPGETIVLPSDTYTLTSGELAIATSLTISGHGSGDTIVRASGAFRIFHVTGASNVVTIAGVTISDGHPTTSIASGAGVQNDSATLTLQDVVVANNRADAGGAPNVAGGIAEGGGITNSGGTLNVVRSRITANSAIALGGSTKGGGISEGGGLACFGTCTLDRSTFDANTADSRGGQGAANAGQNGGIAEGGAVFSVVNSGTGPVLSAATINGNLADASPGPGGSGGRAQASSPSRTARPRHSPISRSRPMSPAAREPHREVDCSTARTARC